MLAVPRRSVEGGRLQLAAGEGERGWRPGGAARGPRPGPPSLGGRAAAASSKFLQKARAPPRLSPRRERWWGSLKMGSVSQEWWIKMGEKAAFGWAV